MRIFKLLTNMEIYEKLIENVRNKRVKKIPIVYEARCAFDTSTHIELHA